ncbi:MAG: hypothetical protein ACHQJ6_08165 [Candidatus Berkiellales bacterium]
MQNPNSKSMYTNIYFVSKASQLTDDTRFFLDMDTKNAKGDTNKLFKDLSAGLEPIIGPQRAGRTPLRLSFKEIRENFLFVISLQPMTHSPINFLKRMKSDPSTKKGFIYQKGKKIQEMDPKKLAEFNRKLGDPQSVTAEIAPKLATFSPPPPMSALLFNFCSKTPPLESTQAALVPEQTPPTLLPPISVLFDLIKTLPLEPTQAALMDPSFPDPLLYRGKKKESNPPNLNEEIEIKEGNPARKHRSLPST